MAQRAYPEQYFNRQPIVQAIEQPVVVQQPPPPPQVYIFQQDSMGNWIPVLIVAVAVFGIIGIVALVALVKK